ncbi:MAG: hypothetical protein E7645_01835 [Ruminococcaceae bacterium]|nr:hypothetical protein [Oscillospiraceae bacterium]
MTLFKKALCCILASVMVLGTCACASGEQGDNEKTDAPQQTQAANGSNESQAQETEKKETLDIPDTRYDGEEIVFLTRDEAEWSTVEIFAEKADIKEDVISDAVYTRNDAIYTNYGVTVKEFKINTSEVTGKVQTEVQAPTGDFHAVVTNVVNSAAMSNNTLIWDLNSPETSSLDFSKSYWDTKLIEGLTINDMVFFVTGDIMTLDNDATFCMMFNKTIANECQIPDLYSMVDNYEWTFDKLFEYEQLAIKDPNGDGVLEYDSGVCGFALTDDVFYSMFYAGGLCVVSKDDVGDLYFSLDVERAQNVAERAQRIFAKDFIVNINTVSTNSGVNVPEVGKTCFGDGHALFLGEVLQCVERMRGYDVDFGVIPYPMYDATQKQYYHMMHKTGSVVSIPRSVNKNIEMVASMIEAMAYYSVDTLTKQYYEINLTTKNVKDEQSGPMIDMILDSRVCDLAYYYDWGSALGKLAGALNPTTNTSMASTTKSLSKTVERQMQKAVEKMVKNYGAD